MTPAEITKLSEHAKRAKALMQRSSVTAERAAQIIENYERTLSNFENHITSVQKNDAELSAIIAAMGNGAPVLEDAFRDSQPQGETHAKPSETAHLSEVK
jgi:ABC-type transporter Mla subunit MlaD